VRPRSRHRQIRLCCCGKSPSSRSGICPMPERGEAAYAPNENRSAQTSSSGESPRRKSRPSDQRQSALIRFSNTSMYGGISRFVPSPMIARLVPHESAERREQMEANYLPHEREARIHGIPQQTLRTCNSRLRVSTKISKNSSLPTMPLTNSRYAVTAITFFIQLLCYRLRGGREHEVDKAVADADHAQ